MVPPVDTVAGMPLLTITLERVYLDPDNLGFALSRVAEGPARGCHNNHPAPQAGQVLIPGRLDLRDKGQAVIASGMPLSVERGISFLARESATLAASTAAERITGYPWPK